MLGNIHKVETISTQLTLSGPRFFGTARYLDYLDSSENW